MNLAQFSVRQTVLVNVLFFVCMLAGWAAFQRIPVEFFPDLNLNTVNVTTAWIGASADEVERLVTRKLEEEIGQVTDIQEMRSTSTADLSQIVIDFDEDLGEVQYEAALNDVRAAIDRVRDLPADVKQSNILEIKSNEAFPAVAVAVVDTADVGRKTLREVARELSSRLERVPGVSRVMARGTQDREIRVLVDRDAAARYGLTVSDVADRIRRKNLNLPAGTFGTGSAESTLRARGDYQNPEEILATVVRENPNGTVVRLAEIARLEDGLEKRLFASRYNGKPAEILTLVKKSGADVLDLSTAIEAWIETQSAHLPAGVEIYKTLDTADFVGPRMRILVQNLLTGVVFVVAILWFTIGFRNAVLTSIAIPFSFLTAMILFPPLGISINATTLVGMLLVSGMLVDDAIIVLENIYQHIEEGEPLREAVVNGTQEVMWPVVAAVATTVAAFLPLLLVTGTMGKFVSILPKAVVVCLAASLFECLVILPAHYLDFGSRKRPDEADVTPGAAGRFARLRLGIARFRLLGDRGIRAARAAYSRALDHVLANRGAFAALAIGVLVFSAGWARHLPVVAFPGEFDTFSVMLEAPPEFNLERTDEVMTGIEARIEAMRPEQIHDYSTTLGMSIDSNYDRLTGPNRAMSFLALPHREESVVEPERVLLAVKDDLDAYREQNPEGIRELRVIAQQGGPPLGAPVEVRVHADDYGLGKAIAGEMAAFLRDLPGVYDVDDNLKLGPPEVRLLMDEERASQHGIHFEDLARALRAANDGEVASNFRDPTLGEDIEIRVLLEAEQRRGLQDLLDVELRTPAGYLIKLRDVAEVEVARGYRSYRHYEGKRTVTVYAHVDEDVTTSVAVNQALQGAFADIEQRYPQVEVRYGGEYAKTSEAFANLIAVFPVAFVAIYMILAALFRSYIQPLVVITAIPFGFAGIVLGVALMNYKVSFVLFYASIGLTGVVVNDSLVMVDFINRARAGGLPLLEAVRVSGARRFRPILLTTLTTVMALLPMALALQGYSKTYGPFAAAISFGLIVAMVGTLFVVPLSYTGLIVGQERAARWLREWLGRDRDAEASPASKLGTVSREAS